MAEFSIAKRAAHKLIAYWRRHAAERLEREAAQKQKAIDEKKLLRELEQADLARRQQLLKSKKEK